MQSLDIPRCLLHCNLESTNLKLRLTAITLKRHRGSCQYSLQDGLYIVDELRLSDPCFVEASLVIEVCWVLYRSRPRLVGLVTE